MDKSLLIVRSPLACAQPPRFSQLLLTPLLGPYTRPGSSSTFITWLILARPGLGAASPALSTMAHLGLPVADHKTEGPSTQVTFLGILIDSDLFQLRLPAAKLERLQSLVRLWASRRSCTRKELESFLGHLSQAAIVVHLGRTFLRHLFALMHSRQAPHHFIRLTPPARADIQWWVHFLQSWPLRNMCTLMLQARLAVGPSARTWGVSNSYGPLCS